MLSKKNTQCNATIAPISSKGFKYFLKLSISLFLNKRNRPSETNAIIILYQTMIDVEDSINLPRIPVKPKITTIKCIINKLFFCVNPVIVLILTNL